jgi:hypothetical protein
MIEGQMRAHGEYLLISTKEQVKETSAPGPERCLIDCQRIGYGFRKGLGSRDWRGTLVRISNALRNNGQCNAWRVSRLKSRWSDWLLF